jgi:hypothetical protein
MGEGLRNRLWRERGDPLLCTDQRWRTSRPKWNPPQTNPHSTFGMCFVVHGTREKSARVCLALGELLSQEGVWLVRTLVSLGDPQVTVYVHMNDRAYKIRSSIRPRGCLHAVTLIFHGYHGDLHLRILDKTSLQKGD